MHNYCHLLHEKFAVKTKNSNEFRKETVPNNGIYIVFEKGEHAHGAERIVRVGTHTGEGNLHSRISEHLYAKNKDRSVFRKHIGRCLLVKRHDPFLIKWNIDLTSRKNKEKYENQIDFSRLQSVEDEVSEYIKENLTFITIKTEAAISRTELEGRLLSTVSNCPHCGPSKTWLGRHHPNQKIGHSGLWNIQGLNGRGISAEDAERLGS
jgi:hypothetical protein